MSKLLVQLSVDELKEIIADAVKQQSSELIPSNIQDSNIKVYRRQELAKLFGVTVQTINGWVRCGQLPRPTKIGRIPVFSHNQIKHMFDAK